MIALPEPCQIGLGISSLFESVLELVAPEIAGPALTAFEPEVPAPAC
jgi:hypothetical protein